MRGTHLQHSPHRLNGVFNRIAGMVQPPPPRHTAHKPNCDVIQSVLPDTVTYHNGGLVQADVHEECWAACEALSRRLESELRAAKSAQLSCGEVLLPDDLLPRVAADVLRLAENEPCGLRGCTLFINFETDTECRRIGTVKCDPNTVSTFELFLTLKRDSRSTWHSILPQFIKNLTKGGTIMISPGFTLEKKKLYRSYLD